MDLCTFTVALCTFERHKGKSKRVRWTRRCKNCKQSQNGGTCDLCKLHSAKSYHTAVSSCAVRNDTDKLYVLHNFRPPLVRANFASVSGRQGEIDRRLCKSIWDHISNAFGWYGRGRLVEVEHVFDAQGGLHIVLNYYYYYYYWVVEK